MIYGIGVDTHKIERIVNLYDTFQSKFITKILSDSEYVIFKKFNNIEKQNSYLAKRFAAKEAFVKALGTGFRDKLTMPNISVINNSYGKPEIFLSKEVSEIIPQNLCFFLSLSDEKEYVVAYVVIERN